MENKSPKELNVEAKIDDLVQKIVGHHSSEIEMTSEVGLFQVEEVLMPKIQSCPARHLVELYANIKNDEVKRYI